MKHCTALAILFLVVGCQLSQSPSEEDARIEKMAAELPPHRAPLLDASDIGVRPLVEAQFVPGLIYRPAWEVLSKREWDMEMAAVDSLGRIGAASVAPMIRSLHSSDPRLRLRATRVLARIGPDARQAVAELMHALDDPEPEVRKGAVLALGQIGPDASDAVEPLVRVMSGEE